MSNKLPPRMRAKRTSSGKVYYYYDTCQKPRKWIPLGNIFAEAAKKYAELDCSNAIPEVITFKHVADRYLVEVLPTKSLKSQKSNLSELKNLLAFFNDPPAPIDDIKPIHISQFLDWRRNTPVMANREKALFSHMWNKAREWGYTDKQNPCAGVKGYRECGRDTYVTDEGYNTVWNVADESLKNALDLAYLTGQRPADVLKIKAEDIINGELHIRQNKTRTKLRVIIEGDLKTLMDKLPKEGYLLRNEKGQPLTYDMLRSRFDKARKKADINFNDFQFRDLRAKAGTDKEDKQGMAAAKDQLGHTSESMTTRYIRHRFGKRVNPTK